MVNFDHCVWDEQVKQITDRQVIRIDMPFHGKSKKNIAKQWTLADCGEVLDSLKMDKVIAIGHSWGSMTILRAANKQPTKFAAIGFCNMSFEQSGFGTKLTFSFQHTMLGFRGFYYKAAIKALFGKKSIK